MYGCQIFCETLGCSQPSSTVPMPQALSFSKSWSPGKIGLMQLCCLPTMLGKTHGNHIFPAKHTTWLHFWRTVSGFCRNSVPEIPPIKTCLFLWRPVFEIVTLQQNRRAPYFPWPFDVDSAPAYGIRWKSIDYCLKGQRFQWSKVCHFLKTICSKKGMPIIQRLYCMGLNLPCKTKHVCLGHSCWFASHKTKVAAVVTQSGLEFRN